MLVPYVYLCDFTLSLFQDFCRNTKTICMELITFCAVPLRVLHCESLLDNSCAASITYKIQFNDPDEKPIEISPLQPIVCPSAILTTYTWPCLYLQKQSWAFITQSYWKGWLFVSSHVNLLTPIAEAFISFLFPFDMITLHPLLRAVSLHPEFNSLLHNRHWSKLMGVAHPLIGNNVCVVNVDEDKIYYESKCGSCDYSKKGEKLDSKLPHARTREGKAIEANIWIIN